MFRSISPYTVLELNNGCEFPIKVWIAPDPVISFQWWWGTPEFLWQKSENRVMLHCHLNERPDYKTTLRLSSSTGHEANVTVFCDHPGAYLSPPRSDLLVSDVPGKLHEFTAEIGRESVGVAPLDAEYFQYESASFLDPKVVTTSVPGRCPMSDFGIRVEDYDEWMCWLFGGWWSWAGRKYCTEPDVPMPSERPPCCEGLEDIRDSPDYRQFYFFDDGKPALAVFPFFFPLITGGYAGVVFVHPNGLVATQSDREVKPAIPNDQLPEFWAAYWQHYDNVTEVGGLSGEGVYVVQWSGMVLEGRGELTFQMRFNDRGEWSVRSDLCQDGAALVAHAKTGYQITPKLYGIMPSLFHRGWNFISTCQQQFVAPQLPDWLRVEPKVVDLEGFMRLNLTTVGMTEGLPEGPLGEIRLSLGGKGVVAGQVVGRKVFEEEP